jgi:hypothetical protein
MSFLMLLILGGGLLVVIVVVVVVAATISGRRRPAPMPAPTGDSVTGGSTASRREAREAVLSQLAAKELTREQAEERLAELDNPVPEALPTPPVRRGLGGAGCGCLVVSAIGLLVLVLAILGFFWLRVSHSRSELVHMRQRAVAEEVMHAPSFHAAHPRHMAPASVSVSMRPGTVDPQDFSEQAIKPVKPVVQPEQDGEFEL